MRAAALALNHGYRAKAPLVVATDDGADAARIGEIDLELKLSALNRFAYWRRYLAPARFPAHYWRPLPARHEVWLRRAHDAAVTHSLARADPPVAAHVALPRGNRTGAFR